MENPLWDIVETQIATQRSSRVPFEELCGFYAALVWRSPIPVVAIAADLSTPAVYHLAAAGTFRGGQFRYRKVAEEFARLGKDAFSTKYLTAPIKDRLRVAQDQVRRGRKPIKKLVGVNPNAHKYAGLNTLKDPLGGPDKEVWIGFYHATQHGGDWDRTGWAWRALDDSTLRGDPRAEEAPFYSSTLAREFCRLRFTPTRDEILAGENEKALDDSWFYRTAKAGIRPPEL